MEDAAFQNTSSPAFSNSPKKSAKRFIYLVIGVIVIILIYVLYSRFAPAEKKETKLTPTPSPVPTVVEKITNTPTPEISEEPETPTPTPKPTVNPVDKNTGLDRSKLNIEVQNGSGVAGVAGKVSDYLKDLGYGISAVGNAENFDYTGLTLSVKSGSSDYGDLLKADLEKKYTVSSLSTDLSATISADALIIVGK